MKRRYSSKLKTRKKFKTYKCEGCNSVFHNINLFKHHVKNNVSCRQKLKYCCDFCGYIGYDSDGLRRHLNLVPSCQQCYKEKQFSSGLLPDLSVGKETSKNPDDNTTSYQYMTYSATGIQNNVNLNLTDTTLGNKNFATQLFELNLMKEATRQDSDYMKISRIISSMTNDNLPFLPKILNDENHSTNSIDIDNADSGVLNAVLDDTQDVEVESCIDMRQKQKEIMRRNDNITFTHDEVIGLDLFHLLKASNVPLVMFDRIINFMKKHEGHLVSKGTVGLQRRKFFLESMNKKLYRDDISFMKPKISPVTLSSGRKTNVVTFSFREIILRMVTNKNLFHPENLLLDPDNPFANPPDDGYYGEVNTGTWFQEAKKNVCTQPHHILMPFCHFIDGLSIDKYGKLSVEAVLSCCLWFNRKTRNRASSWFVHGFVEDQKLLSDQKNYMRCDKMQDYHDMMSKIFEEMKLIYDRGGVQLTLDFGCDKIHNVIALPVTQFIIGDCKGNDVLCGRKGGHSLNMKGLCRDCTISPIDGDDVCLGTPLKCRFITIEDVLDKSPEELEEYSFLPINNCFNHISFGGCNRNIYGATPAEILHAVLLGLCEYISEAIDLIFTPTCIEMISEVVIGIYKDSKRQSERDLPDIGPFKTGLNSVKCLKAKERFTRIYCVFLALSNSYLITSLCLRKKKKFHDDEDVTFITRDLLENLYTVIHDTLLFHQWLKQDKFKKSDFMLSRRGVESKAMRRIKEYLLNFKHVIKRGGNNLKTPKFHQMLHICDYIQRHGSPLNYDGSRGENFGKVKIKDNAKLTRKEKVVLNFDIGRRISEEDVIDNASYIYHQKNAQWPSEFCNDIDILSNDRDESKDTEINEYKCERTSSKPRYKLICDIDYNDNNNYGLEETIDVRVDWGGQALTPVKSFPTNLLKLVAARLFIGSNNIGGKLVNGSVVPGYTEIKVNNNTYRCHPFYANTGSWYDWAYFSWEGYDNNIPARILMILDLSECDISYEPDIHPDQINHTPNQTKITHLTKEKWVVVKASTAPRADDNDLSEQHLNSRIIHRITLDPDMKIWMIPLKTLVKPCYVVYNKNYCDASMDKEVRVHDNTAYIVDPMSVWPCEFLHN